MESEGPNSAAPTESLRSRIPGPKKAPNASTSHVTKSFQYFDSMMFFRVRLESVACEFDSRFPIGHFIRL
jgi:hypothetical protein